MSVDALIALVEIEILRHRPSSQYWTLERGEETCTEIWSQKSYFKWEPSVCMVSSPPGSSVYSSQRGLWNKTIWNKLTQNKNEMGRYKRGRYLHHQMHKEIMYGTSYDYEIKCARAKHSNVAYAEHPKKELRHLGSYLC